MGIESHLKEGRWRPQSQHITFGLYKKTNEQELILAHSCEDEKLTPCS